MSTTIMAAYAETKKRAISELGSMAIPDGGVVKLWEGYTGRAIRCLSGAAWITQEGDGRDYVLDPGEELFIDREGVVVIQGLGNTRVTIL
jgi:hypothetical protein